MHWITESIYNEAVACSIFDESVDVSVRAEVPMLGNERQERRGNRYFPTLIDVECPDSFSLHVAEARELAAKLIAAADAADAIDLPDTDTCGHWAPCDYCKKPAEGVR